MLPTWDLFPLCIVQCVSASVSCTKAAPLEIELQNFGGSRLLLAQRDLTLEEELSLCLI